MSQVLLSKPVTKLPVWLPPFLSATVWLPTVAVPAFTVSDAVTDCKPVKFFANCNCNFALPSAPTAAEVTPILLPVARSEALVTPPVMSTCLLSLTLDVAPMSPLNLRPSFKVATSSLEPSGFWYVIRVVVVPGAPSTPG